MSLRFWSGIAAVAVIAVGSVAAAFAVYENDNSDFEQMQRAEAVRAAHQTQAVAALSVGKLSGAAAFFQADQSVSQHQFKVIGRSLLGGGALDAAGFVPRVRRSERASYEARFGVPISDLGFGRSLLPSPDRPVYYPITYATRYPAPQKLMLGLDLATAPARAGALREARDSGEATATDLVPLLLGGQGINVFWPIYRDRAPVQTRAQRHRALQGFIVGVFRVHDLAAAAAAALPGDAAVQLRVEGRSASGPSGQLDDAASAPVRIADRTWTLLVADSGGPNLALPLALAVMGIALAALLGSLIFAWSRNERLHELERQASQDALTGLANRRRFEQDLRAAMARSRRDRTTGALLMLDLDEFKRVNDSRGHPAGDHLIKEVAEVLRKRTRESDALARLGGDEFAVILSRCSREEARLVGEALGKAVRDHGAEDALGSITASIGVAMFGEDPRTSAATVISEADTAMYAAKDAGRDQVRLFDPAALRDARDPS